MPIRKAEDKDKPDIMRIFTLARAFMRSQGNTAQWNREYPGLRDVEDDIEAGSCFVLEENGELLAVFSLVPGPDPTYAAIEGGNWTDDGDYCALHRLASSRVRPGAGGECLRWCVDHARSVRVDTHEVNAPMRRLLEKNGFTFCGIIHVEDGTPRMAYQITRVARTFPLKEKAL